MASTGTRDRFFKQALRALALQHGAPVPGGEAALAALPAPGSAGAAAAWQAFAQVLQGLAFRPPGPPPEWLLLSLLEAQELAWLGLERAQRVQAEGFVAWLQAQAMLGQLDPLRQAVLQHLDLLTAPGHEGLATEVLRLARQHGTLNLLPNLMHALGGRALQGDALTREVAAAALHLARHASDWKRLRGAADWLDRLLPLLGRLQTGQDEGGFFLTLSQLALATQHLDAMRQLLSCALAAPVEPRHADALAAMLNRLCAWTPGAVTHGLLQGLAERLPGHPQVQLEMARHLLLQHGPSPALVERLKACEPSQTGFHAAMTWLANMLFRFDEVVLAEQFFRRAAESAPLSPADQLRLTHLAARREAGEGAQVAEPEAPPPVLDPALLGRLAPLLPPLQALAETEPVHDAPETPEALAARADAVLAAFEAGLAALPTLSLAQALQLAQGLVQMAQLPYFEQAHWACTYPVPMGPRYGRWDARRCLVLWRALWDATARLAERVVAWPQALAGEAPQGGLRPWLELLRTGVEALVLLQQGPRALALLDQADQQLGPVLALALRQQLRERVLLSLGDLPAARAQRAALAVWGPAEVWPLQDWATWAAAAGTPPRLLCEDAARSGPFDYVGPDGRLQQFVHDMVPLRLELQTCRDLQLGLGHALINAQGAMLAPSPWYTLFCQFPYDHVDVLNRGQQGAALRAPAATREVTEPVAVLANMDALEHRNYYHWMLLTLERIVHLLECGLLDERRLLLPAELPGWMQESLNLVGLPAERCLTYRQDERLLLRDALVASPSVFASPALLARLRERLWRAAGLDPAAPPAATRCLFISRRGENRRPLVEEEALTRLAEAQGYEVVEPGRMSLPEQVRLFAEARTVVGASGAALTNLLWMQPGGRVLVVFKEEGAVPFFVSLALMQGLHYRWLLGRNLPAYRMMNLGNSPYSVDLALAQRELAWARQTAERSP